MKARRILRLETTASTMLEAERHPAGTVVVAEEQTAGQGRFGRTWHSERGAGLYFSQVLEPLANPVDLPVVTLALGLAVQEAIAVTAGLSCDLRWPNDVLAGGRKCAGILVQYQNGKLVSGTGVNVNHRHFPAELAAIATSLRIETGREHDLERLLEALLDAIDEYLATLGREGRRVILDLFSRSSSYVYGRRVTAGHLTGTTDGLNEFGFLWLKTDGGARHLIRAGNVRPV